MRFYDVTIKEVEEFKGSQRYIIAANTGDEAKDEAIKLWKVDYNTYPSFSAEINVKFMIFTDNGIHFDLVK
jgi:hypothetical protein